MGVPPATRLLVLSDDERFQTEVTATINHCSDLTQTIADTPSAARTHLAGHPVDGVIVDVETDGLDAGAFHAELQRSWPTVSLIIASPNSRATLRPSLSFHAFVCKRGPLLGTSLPELLRIVTARRRTDDRSTVTP